MSKFIRICLDLNIWCASLLADFKGKEDTSCQILVKIIRQRYCNLGEVKLIISWGMINRLRKVLEQDLKVSPSTTENYLNAISEYANSSPQLTLGGIGVIPLNDTEDRHVLETCLAGKADILVTNNFKDFITKDTQIILENTHAIYNIPNHSLQIVNSSSMVKWIKTGNIPLYKK